MFSVVYHPEAREEATALPVKIRVKFDRLIGKLEYDARLLREPDTKPLGDGLFEIRTMGTDIARGIWVYHKGNTIIMLRVFIKKSQKTPAKEIDLAKKRLAEVLKEGANKRGNSSRLTQSFHFFMFEPIFSPVNALNQPI